MPRGTPKTPATIPISQEVWKQNFRTSCMKIGFGLNLSKTMLEYLCAVSDDAVWDRALYWSNGCPESFICTENCLQKRGLIQRKPQAEIDKLRHVPGRQCVCELTPAGRLVVELVKLSGMFVESDDAIGKKSKRGATNAAT